MSANAGALVQLRLPDLPDNYQLEARRYGKTREIITSSPRIFSGGTMWLTGKEEENYAED